MIRKSGIITLAVILILFVVGMFIFTDKWVEGILEDFGSSAIGAKVEIDGLDISLLSLKFKVSRLQVTDPDHTMRNMFETGLISFQLNFPALFKKKFIIENVVVNDFQTFTPRRTDGKLPKKKKEKSKPGFMEKQVSKLAGDVKEQIPVAEFSSNIKNMNVDDVLKKANIQSPRKMDSLKTWYKDRQEYWDNKLKETRISEDLKEVEDKLNAINPKQVEKLKDLQDYLTELDQFKKHVDSLKRVYKTTHSELTEDLKLLKSNAGQIKNWVENDYALAADILNIADMDKTGIAELLVGGKLMNAYTKFTFYHQKYKSFMDKQKDSKPPKEKKPRFKGQDIPLVNPQKLPSFWIKTVNLSGKTSSGFKIECLINDICFQPQVINKPTVIKLTGTRQDDAVIGLDATLDHISKKYHDWFQMQLIEVPIVNYHLSDYDYLPRNLKKGLADSRVEINAAPDTLETQLALEIKNSQFEFTESASPEKTMVKLNQLVRDAFSEIHTVNLTSRLSVENEKTSLKINSNLDMVFAQAMKSALGKELERVKAEVRDKVDAQIEPYKKELEKEISAVTSRLEEEKDKLNSQIKEQEEAIDAKKKDLQKEIKKKAGDKGKKLLDNLLK